MVLASFGVKISQTKLARLARTNNRYGTLRVEMKKVLQRFGFKPVVFHHASLPQLKKLIRQGPLVIVNYRELKHEVEHYSVVAGFEGQKIILHDPWSSKNFRLPQKEFYRRWGIRNLKNKDPRWMMAVFNPRQSG